MKRILITGMSGTGKSSVIEELARRGFRAVDTDSDEWSVWSVDAYGNPDWVWREDRLHALLDAESAVSLFVCGCKSNQGKFYSKFEHVVLLSASAEVILERVRTRTNNPFGKTPEDQAMILEHLEVVEPLLRPGADLELNSARLNVLEMADALVQLVGEG